MDYSPPGSSPGKNTGCHFLLQGTFPTQGSNPGLLHCRQTLYPLSHQGSLQFQSVGKQINVFIILVWQPEYFYCVISRYYFRLEKTEIVDREGLFYDYVYTISHVWFFANPMDCSPPSSSVHGISQARVLEWVAISSSRGSSWSKGRMCVSSISGIGRKIVYHWATRKVPILWESQLISILYVY